ncbi:hypothetical protein D3880_18960 [Pseudomonas cavernae]|uniref:Uncharacterized protein n=1 Tax=Pseudomonas cavernae TaxID=2320867 RepID=A0A385Z593_9PSED|nr:hypothetical protein D3880_18960 [Pseudomonas cavernae]
MKWRQSQTATAIRTIQNSKRPIVVSFFMEARSLAKDAEPAQTLFLALRVVSAGVDAGQCHTV